MRKLLKIARTLLGTKLFILLMKSSFYGHFVAGENRHTIVPTLERCPITPPLSDYYLNSQLTQENSTTLIRSYSILPSDLFQFQLTMDCLPAFLPLLTLLTYNNTHTWNPLIIPSWYEFKPYQLKQTYETNIRCIIYLTYRTRTYTIPWFNPSILTALFFPILNRISILIHCVILDFAYSSTQTALVWR